MTLQTGALITPTVRLARQLGEGGMGAVWVADHLTLERQVAVKLIRSFDPSPDARARFEREAKAAARIASPHVVQIYDYGVTDEGQPYIIMELLAGESLAERLEAGALPPETLAPILMQTASALASAHDSGVVHRDIKPANIFLVETPGDEPFVKVLDFGIAKLNEPNASGPSGTEVMDGKPAPAPLTSTGTIVGTPEYMSPEQLLTTDDITPRSDIWSLGVVAYEALAGARPFSGETIIALSMAICDARYEPERVPASLRPWFERAFAVKAAERFESAMGAAKEFRALSTGEIKAVTGSTAAVTAPTEAVDATASAPPTSAAAASGSAPAAVDGFTRRTVAVLATLAFVVSAAAVVASQRDTNSEATTASNAGTNAPATQPSSADTSTAASASTASATSIAADGSATPDGSTAPSASTSAPTSDGSSGPALATGAAGPAPAARTFYIADKCKQPCREIGLCKLLDGYCIPGSDADCAQSQECRRLGYCGKSGDRCRATSEAHCAASHRCKTQGQCGLSNLHCAATQDAHCRNSSICTERGRCTAKSKQCIPGSRADCMQSSRCKSQGECTPNGMICQVRSPADCQQSSRCASHGECEYVGYDCRKPRPPKPEPPAP